MGGLGARQVDAEIPPNLDKAAPKATALPKEPQK
jgi:hypothetical protein